jgi:hypothetical protein
VTLSDCVVYCRGHEVIPLLPQCRSAACHREMYASLHVRFTTGWARGRPFESAGDGDLPAPGNVACRNSVSLSTWWPTGRVRQGTIMGSWIRSGQWDTSYVLSTVHCHEQRDVLAITTHEWSTVQASTL